MTVRPLTVAVLIAALGVLAVTTAAQNRTTTRTKRSPSLSNSRTTERTSSRTLSRNTASQSNSTSDTASDSRTESASGATISGRNTLTPSEDRTRSFRTPSLSTTGPSPSMTKSDSAHFVPGRMALTWPSPSPIDFTSTSLGTADGGSGGALPSPLPAGSLQGTVDGTNLRFTTPVRQRQVIVALSGVSLIAAVAGGDARQCVNVTTYPPPPPAQQEEGDVLSTPRRYTFLEGLQVTLSSFGAQQLVTLTFPVLTDAVAPFAWDVTGPALLVVLQLNKTCYKPAVASVLPGAAAVIAVTRPGHPTALPTRVAEAVLLAHSIIAVVASAVHGAAPLAVHDAYTIAAALRGAECNLRDSFGSVAGALNPSTLPWQQTLLPFVVASFDTEQRPTGIALAALLVWLVPAVVALIVVRLQMTRPGWFAGNASSAMRLPAVVAPLVFVASVVAGNALMAAAPNFGAATIVGTLVLAGATMLVTVVLLVAPTAAIGGAATAARWYSYRDDASVMWGEGSAKRREERAAEARVKVVAAQRAMRRPRPSFADLSADGRTAVIVTGVDLSDDDDNNGSEPPPQSTTLSSRLLDVEDEPPPLLPALDPISRFIAGEGYWNDEIYNFDQKEDALTKRGGMARTAGALPLGATAWKCGHYRRFYTILDGYRRRFLWFAVVDMLAAWAATAPVFGVRPPRDECGAVNAALCAIIGARAVAIVALRPYRTPFLNATAVITAGASTLASVFGIVYWSQTGAYWALTGSTVACFGGVAVALLRSVLLIGFVVAERQEQAAVRVLVNASNRRYFDAWWSIVSARQEQQALEDEAAAREKLRRYEARRKQRLGLETPTQSTTLAAPQSIRAHQAAAAPRRSVTFVTPDGNGSRRKTAQANPLAHLFTDDDDDVADEERHGSARAIRKRWAEENDVLEALSRFGLAVPPPVAAATPPALTGQMVDDDDGAPRDQYEGFDDDFDRAVAGAQLSFDDPQRYR